MKTGTRLKRVLPTPICSRPSLWLWTSGVLDCVLFLDLTSILSGARLCSEQPLTSPSNYKTHARRVAERDAELRHTRMCRCVPAISTRGSSTVRRKTRRCKWSANGSKRSSPTGDSRPRGRPRDGTEAQSRGKRGASNNMQMRLAVRNADIRRHGEENASYSGVAHFPLPPILLNLPVQKLADRNARDEVLNAQLHAKIVACQD
ncbi:hypothetical protein B0H11DRAFT_436642 [Mycena galericulata]|nr:hypothetical protein B0H11DRAFT_436642 [Mycena galericulata]